MSESTDSKTIASKGLTYTSWRSPLKLVSTEYGEVKRTELLVKTKAASVNPVDCLVRIIAPTWYKGNVVKTMGSDFSGEVVKAGEDSGYKPGDKVFGGLKDYFGPTGTFSEYILVDSMKTLFLGKIPSGMSFEDAAALPVAAGAAYQCLKTHSQPLKDGNLLILGGGTSVGSFAAQFAKGYFDVKTVVATCSEESTARVKQTGADVCVDYKKGHQHEVNGILEAVNKYGKFDLIIDCVRDCAVYGKLKTILKPSNKEGGVLTMLKGTKSMNHTSFKYVDLLPPIPYMIEWAKEKTKLSKLKVNALSEYKDDTFIEAVNQIWAKKKLAVQTDSVFVFQKIEKAIEKVAMGKAKGKVIVKM